MELFADNIVFFYLIIAAFLVAVFWRAGLKRKQNVIKLLFSPENYKNLIPAVLQRRRKISDILFLSGLFFLFIAWAGPQWGREKLNVISNFSQAVIAVDVSSSMLADDVKPSRLASAKTMVTMLINDMLNERLGIIAFTSRAYLQCPITTDITALKTLASSLSVDMLPVQGTALAPALKLASQMLSPYSGKKALVMVSDGEDHEPQDVEEAVKTALENNIKIIAIGIGSEEGGLIPVNTTAGKSFKKDKEGKTVLTRLDEKALIALASATGGAYIKYTTAQQVSEEVAMQLASLDKSSSQGIKRAGYKNRYQIPLFIGFVLILSSILIPLRKVE